MKNKFLLLLLLAAFVKGVVWLLLTPIFQVPDEPSHLSYIQFLFTVKRLPLPRREVVTSKENLAVAQIVNFDWRIDHPVWRGYQSDWQEKINRIDPGSQKKFSTNLQITSFKRPGLYYRLAAGFYGLFSKENFLWRFYSVRLFSLLCHLLTVYLTYLIAVKLTKKTDLGLAATVIELAENKQVIRLINSE